MEKFETFTGVAMPLKKTNVDTDQTIPARFMKRVTKTGYEDALFHSWRQDPDFVLNDARYERASTLIAGADFGTGSSREHAVWALRDYGFRAVFSPRFADIFRGNSGKQGLLAGELPQPAIEQVWRTLDADPDTEITVDLESRTLQAGPETLDFEIDDYTRWRLLEGLDDISLTLQHEDVIAAFEQRRPAWLPRTLPAR
ncbi:3-isopropylmalate dehydratase small subunit [Microbacterium sp. NPDC090003]|uniref:3-isopropylmalate dehydratase small subunit n=1 Tax=Microbacterium sp. NPDC090003 TaxID=3364203 RepID=UPI003830D9B2